MFTLVGASLTLPSSERYRLLRTTDINIDSTSLECWDQGADICVMELQRFEATGERHFHLYGTTVPLRELHWFLQIAERELEDQP